MNIPTSLITKELFSKIKDLTFLVDVEGRIMKTGKQIYKLLEFSEEELQNVHIATIIKNENVKHLVDNCELITETVKLKNVYISSKSGNIIPFDISVTPLKNRRGKNTLGVLILGQDIRPIRRLQDEISSHKLTSDKLHESYKEIDKVNRELMKINALLHDKSIRDSLTNLYNHSYISEILNKEIDKAKKLDTNLWVMMLDIDFFKSVNDSFGHQAGDKVLVDIANLIKSSIRSTDYAGRYGGEEFIVILLDLTVEKAYEVAERIRANIENFDFGLNNTKITASVGLARLKEDNGKQLENRADALLYLAKNNGRNRIEYDKENE